MNFDEDQEFFACPFCGEEFNYTDFHRDELLSQASRCLKYLRFVSAKEKYETLLSNNPQDFEALRGMVLVRGKITSLDSFKSPENLRECDLTGAKKVSDDAASALTVPGEKVYFERLSKLIGIGEEFLSKTKDALANSDKAREIYRKAAEMDRRSRENLKATGAIIGMVFYGMAAVLIAVIRIALEMTSTWLIFVSLAVFGVIALIVLLFFLIHRYRVRHIVYKVAKPSEYLTSGHIIQDFLSDEAREISRKYTEVWDQLSKEDPALNGYTPPPAQKKSAADPFVDIEKTVICAQCGGQLLLVKEKGLFECRSCGVAYGTSLFFNSPLVKADQALERSDFVEADQRFSHALMVKPGDFHALTGRILCAGKWKSIEEIRLPNTMIPVVEQRLSERAGEALEHSSENDKRFFYSFSELVKILIRFAQNEQELRRCEKDLKNVKNTTEIHITGSAMQKELSGKTSEIEKQLKNCDQIRQELGVKYEELRAVLISESNLRKGCGCEDKY